MTEEAVSRGERTRAEIIQAAHSLFLERGYHGTSMRQIAERAGIALGGIYNHFASKEDIFVATVMDHHPFYSVVPAMAAAQGETIEAFIQDAAQRMVAGIGNRYEYLNLMFIELVEFHGKHIAGLFQKFVPLTLDFTQRFVEGRAELRPIPVPILLRAFIGLFFSYVITELLVGDQMPTSMRENALDHFVDIYLHGILKQAA